MSEYIAGSCNIGPSEIKQRQRVAYIGGLLYLISAITLIATNAATSTRLLLFIPALICSVGFIQARRKFCVAFGFMGVFNFEKVGGTRKITINADLAADRKYAVKLLLQSVLAAIALTALVLFI